MIEQQKIRTEKGPEIESMTRQEYAEWLVDNRLEEKDLYELLVAKPQFRKLTVKELEQLKETSPETEGWKGPAQELFEIWKNFFKKSAHEGIDTYGADRSSWRCFKVNRGVEKRKEEVDKGYLSFNKAADLRGGDFKGFLEKLQEVGFDGDVKTLSKPESLMYRFDTIVFHGNDEKNVELALGVAQDVFGNKISSSERGKDINKGRTSHTTVLAEWVHGQRYERA